MLERHEYRLRPIQKEDLQQVLEWRNSDRVRAYMYTNDIITWEQHQQWFESNSKNPSVLHQICEFQDRPFGVVNATKIDKNNRSCYWGFYLGNLTAPKGSSYVMGLLFLDSLFNNLSLEKVYGEVLAFNTASIGFHRNIGFEHEKLLKQHVFKENIGMDIIEFELSSKQWYAVRHIAESRLFDSQILS